MRLFLIFIALFIGIKSAAQNVVSVGSKNFTESYILAELLSDTLARQGVQVQERFGLGGTGVVLESLRQGQIQVYPEYTGTILETLLPGKLKDPSVDELNEELKKQGLIASGSLGFNNTYALIVRRETAEKFGLKKISDLNKIGKELNGGMSHEFLKRSDGFYALKSFYKMGDFKSIKGLEHSLAYEALANGAIDFTDAYTTDGKLEKFNFVLLEDDRAFFPKYEAVWLARLDFASQNPKLWQALRAQEGKLSEEEMIQMNSVVEDKIATPSGALAEFGYVAQTSAKSESALLKRLLRYGKEHLILVFSSVFLALTIGFPLAYGATKNERLRQIVMVMTSIFQTVPSLALLCFLIPFFGVGQVPALIALVLYALLPIVVNSYTGLSLVSRISIDMAKQLGMSPLQSLWHVQLPLAMPSILDGIKTSAITTVGTATLAALIGAGGYGTPILSGLALNDQATLLEGAIPVCVLALLTQWGFQLLGQRLVSRGLY